MLDKGQLPFFVCGYSVSPVPFVEKTVLSPFNSFVKNHFNIYVRIYFCIFIGLSMPVPHCFDYCGFVLRFEIRKYESCSFIVLFQDCFGLFWGPLSLHMNFRMGFSVLQKPSLRF